MPGAPSPGPVFRGREQMPKRKRGHARLELTHLLEVLAGMYLAPQVRLVAVLLYDLGPYVSPEKLSRYTGLTIASLEENVLGIMEIYGLLERAGGELRLRVPRIVRGRGKRKRQTVPDKAAQANRLVDEYKRLWREKYKARCIVNGQVRSQAHKLVCELGVVEATARLTGYLADSDPWLVDKAHPFGVLAKCSNRYARRKSGKASIIGHNSDFESEVRAFEERERREAQERDGLEEWPS